MRTLFPLVAVLATTLGTAAAQVTPSAKSKPATKSTKVVVSPGGQGHNSGPDPKGKILVAPTTSPKGKPASN